MFGLVTPSLSKLSDQEKKSYQGYYCGLCQNIKQQHNNIARLALTFDMTFLAILLSSIDEPENKLSECRCVFKSNKKLTTIQNKYTHYAADMTIILAYHKLSDDVYDDNSLLAKIGSKVLLNNYSLLCNKYPEFTKLTEQTMKEIRSCETKNNPESGDRIAKLFGHLLGIMFAEPAMLCKDYLYKFGFDLGRLIFYMDAAIDFSKDFTNNKYNPFSHSEYSKSLSPELFQTKQEYLKEARKTIEVFSNKAIYENFANYLRNQLTNFAGLCSSSYEKLPLGQNQSILDNIIYEGIWATFNIKYKIPSNTIE